MCLRDTRSMNFKDNIFGIVNVSLYDDPVYFSYYSKASSPYSQTASKEEGYGKSVDSDFSPIDDSDYIKQLRVLTVLNENFEVDLIPFYDEFMLSKNRIKKKYFQDFCSI